MSPEQAFLHWFCGWVEALILHGEIKPNDSFTTIQSEYVQSRINSLVEMVVNAGASPDPECLLFAGYLAATITGQGNVAEVLQFASDHCDEILTDQSNQIFRKFIVAAPPTGGMITK